MKDKNLKSVILTGLGMTMGFILYDLLFGENIDWGKAILAGVLVILFSVIFKKSSR